LNRDCWVINYENIYRKFNFISEQDSIDFAIKYYSDEFKNEYDVQEYEIQAKCNVYLITSKNLDPDEIELKENYNEIFY